MLLANENQDNGNGVYPVAISFDMSTHLTPEQIAELRSDLEAELRRLQRSMTSTATASEPVALDQASVGRLSRMDAMANQQMAKTLHERELALELRILDALRRVDGGSYGVCLTCGHNIPYGRLLVMPETRTCTACGGG